MPSVPCYSAAQVREMDRRAIQEQGIPGYTLMTRAGEAAFRILKTTWPQARRVIVLCGPGNNGGDGYVIAGLAARSGMQTRVLETGPPERQSAESRRARDFCLQAGVTPEPARASALLALPADTIIVDALLGIGVKGAVRSPFAELITAINDASAPVLAVDIPSGLCSDTGQVLGVAVKACHTVTFIGRKAGLVLGEGRNFTGRCHFDDLGVPPTVRDGMVPLCMHETLA